MSSTPRQLSSSTLNMKFMQRANAMKAAVAPNSSPQKSGKEIESVVSQTSATNTLPLDNSRAKNSQIIIEHSYLPFPHLLGKRPKKKKVKSDSKRLAEKEPAEMDIDEKPSRSSQVNMKTEPMLNTAPTFKRPAGFEGVKKVSKAEETISSSESSSADDFVDSMIEEARAKRAKKV